MPEHQLSHAGAVGSPVVNVQVGIMSEDGALLPQGAEGEIVYRGPHALTEAITAIVVPRSGADVSAETLLPAVRSHLDGRKVPKAVIVVSSLPRTSTGKIQKNVLREQYAHFCNGQL
jgi:acyl-CoA synthetase (AMP-forming)/AMP-acid ligase II